MPNSTEKLSFEEALKELETIVEKMDEGVVSLDETVELYKRGSELTKLCRQKLEKAELTIQKLNADGNLEALKEKE